MREFWISAHTQYGDLFGDSIVADSVDDLFAKFAEKYPNCHRPVSSSSAGNCGIKRRVLPFGRSVLLEVE